MPQRSSPRVLHLVPNLFDESDGIIGGAERYAFELARHMADEVPTTLLSFGERDREEQRGTLRIKVLGSPWYVRGQKTNPLSIKLVPELLRADVIHCHQQHLLMSSMSAIVGRAAGRPVFVSDLGGGGWDLSSYMSTDRLFTAHLHISEYSRRVFGHEGKPWAHVILGGVDTEKFSPRPRARLDGPALYVGRLLPHKGVDELIRSLPPHLDLEIIGRAYNARYWDDLSMLAEGKPVHFRRDASDNDLVEAYRSACCVVLPSLYRDCYGNESRVPELLGQTLLEGMACGIPGICTDVASMPEVVVDGVTGFVVPPNDHAAMRARLAWIDEHREEAAKMGEAARRHVLEKFSWPAVVRRCLAIYAGGRD